MADAADPRPSASRMFPAVELIWPVEPGEDETDLLLAALDDAGPTAVETHARGMRVFFRSERERDAAVSAIRQFNPSIACEPLLVPDDNWAERSQAALLPVRIGRVIVAPPWTIAPAGTIVPEPPDAQADDIVIAIQPSMGFGTGHHASTRLCLALLQRHLTAGAKVLDVGTGSGVLAIAAWRLGAAHALGIDFDPDALASAAENVVRNQAADGVTLEAADITEHAQVFAGAFGLVLANITGAMLIRHAIALVATLERGGTLIASGFQQHERDAVVAAFSAAGAALMDDVEEQSWVAAAFTTSPTGSRAR